MRSTSIPDSLPEPSTRRASPRASPFMPILVGILIALIVVAVWQPFARRPAKTTASHLRGDTDEAVGALTEVLMRTPQERRESLLLQYVQDPSPGLRYASVDALARQRGPGAADAIERAFLDSSSVVRQCAMEALPSVDPERGLRLLLAGLRDEDSWIREAAVEQLAAATASRRTFVDRRAVPTLIRALDDPDRTVSRLAMGALHKLTGRPWQIRQTDSTEQQRAVIDRWKEWWAHNSTTWTVPSAYRDVAAIRPDRMDPAPDFNLTGIDGRPLRPADQRGRATLLNFWGTWCGGCQLEIPDLVRLDQAYRSRKLDIIGIALSETEGADGLRRWCRAHNVEYRQALATDAILDAYGDIHEVPVSILIDAQGRVRRRWDGERDFATFRAAVEQILPAPLLRERRTAPHCTRIAGDATAPVELVSRESSEAPDAQASRATPVWRGRPALLPPIGRSDLMQKRPYGNTGEELSIVAMGGIVVMGVEQAEADRRTREAFDRGINYFDVAPSYGDAEDRLGPALVGLRDGVFLACKTGKRTREEAAQELRDSLRRLRTDRFDLYQLHGVSSVQEAQTCLGPGGAIEAFIEARDAGLVRYLGFSAHSAEAAMLLLEQFPFNSILFPFNYTTYYQAGFGPQVLEKAQEKGAARLALKAMARRPWPDGADRSIAQNTWYEPHMDPREAELALRWALSLPITAAVPPGDPNQFRMALDFADRFIPLTPAEVEAVETRARENAPLFKLAA